LPVPIDMEVLWSYQELAGDLCQTGNPGLLDRTDLLCAATAIVYKAQMYTTKPEAYEGLGTGLRLLKYGATRNKDASDKVVNRMNLPPAPRE
jgi:hypothetical protein